MSAQARWHAFTESVSNVATTVSDKMSTVELPNVQMPNMPTFSLSDAQYMEAGSIKIEDVRLAMDSKNPKDTLEAMKRIQALVCMGRDVSMFYPDVVRNVETDVLELKLLVYHFLARYSESNPDAALLSINSFQKDLNNSNQRIRALALTVLSSIRVPVIASLVTLAVTKCAQDQSPVVRQIAAAAIPKIYQMDPNQKGELMKVLKHLLGDSTTPVLGTALGSFQEVCPDDWSMIHPHFRKICGMMPDLNEWALPKVLNIMLHYGRAHFPDARGKKPQPEKEVVDVDWENGFEDGDRRKRGRKHGKHSKHKKRERSREKKKEEKDKERDKDKEKGEKDKVKDQKDRGNDEGRRHGRERHRSDSRNDVEKPKSRKKESFYSDGSGDGLTEADQWGSGLSTFQEEPDLDPDLELLLRGCAPLMKHRHRGVLLGVANIFYYLAPMKDAMKIGTQLAQVLEDPTHLHCHYLILDSIRTFSADRPEMFQDHLKCFFLKGKDQSYRQKLKVEILANLVNTKNYAHVLYQFVSHLDQPDKELVECCIRALGVCAISLPSIRAACMKSLLELTTRSEEHVVAETVVTIRYVLQRDPSYRRRWMKKLFKLLQVVHAPVARAAILCILHEYYDTAPRLLPEALRRLARTFSDESNDTKMQALRGIARVLLDDPANERVHDLFTYYMDLGWHDDDTDIRSLSRSLRTILLKEFPETLRKRVTAEMTVEAEPSKLETSAIGDDASFTAGTLAHLFQHSVPGYRKLPDNPLHTLARAEREKMPERPLYDGPKGGGPRDFSGRPSRQYANMDDNEFYSSEGSYSDGSYSSRSYSFSSYSSRSRSRSSSHGRGRRRRHARSRSPSSSYSVSSGSYSSSGSSYTGSYSSRSRSASASSRSRSRSRSSSPTRGTRSRSASPLRDSRGGKTDGADSDNRPMDGNNSDPADH
eukprot:Rmarinus@m.6489